MFAPSGDVGVVSGEPVEFVVTRLFRRIVRHIATTVC
jgi:hypothetical protein